MSVKVGLVMMLITAFVALAGAATFYVGWTELNESIASTGWPATERYLNLV
ncbi:MAG: hypothetical protein L6R45_01170 [Anaerolineae bacterium]|nr:hypothetical protein [Anaerolineae bacterium]